VLSSLAFLFDIMAELLPPARATIYARTERRRCSPHAHENCDQDRQS
jgi:hypothetical protein